MKKLVILLMAALAFAGTEDNYTPLEYDGDGLSSDFTFTWPIGSTSDIEVIIKTISTEAEVVLVLDTDYTVSATNNDYSGGGTVTTIETYSNLYTISLRRDTVKEQDADLVDTRRLRVQNIEDGLDKLTRLTQELQEEIGRCIKLPKTDAGSTELPTVANRADLNVTFDSNGDVSATSVLSTGTANISAYMVTLLDDASAAVAQTTLLLKDATASLVLLELQTKGPWADVKAYDAVGDGTDQSTEFAAAVADAGDKLVRVTEPTSSWNVVTWPTIPADSHIAYDYDHWDNSDPILQVDGTRGGWFADYDLKSARQLIVQTDEDTSTIELGANGAFRDALFIQMQDVDNTDYESGTDLRVTHGLRTYVTGRHDGSNFTAQYKDLVAGLFVSQGNISWDDRGVSAITADAIQYGDGICSNEFIAYNPAAGDGGQEQSKSMAAIQAHIKNQYAAQDGTHASRGLLVTSDGEDVTSGIQVLSTIINGNDSRFRFGLNMGDADVITDGAAIVMPTSQSGDSGTIIEYDSNEYSSYDRATNTFNWTVASGDTPLQVNANTMTVGTAIVNTMLTFDNTGTPSAVGGNVFATTGTTTITDFDGGTTGQILTVICAHSLTFDFITGQDADHNLDGSSADITADNGDILVFLSTDGTTWQLVSNNDASADNN